MTLPRALRRVAALAAAAGIALQALWPLLAQARPAVLVSVPVCSAAGAHRSTELPIGGGQTGQGAAHCKLCVLGDSKPVVSGSQSEFALPSEGKLETSFEKIKSEPRSAFAAFARPRAPPASL